jgi:hypothetical protein
MFAIGLCFENPLASHNTKLFEIEDVETFLHSDSAI